MSVGPWAAGSSSAARAALYMAKAQAEAEMRQMRLQRALILSAPPEA